MGNNYVSDYSFKKTIGIALGVFFVAATIQFGGNSLFSTSFISFIFVLSLVNIKSYNDKFAQVLLGIFLFGFSLVPFVTEDDFWKIALRAFRELVLFAFFISVVNAKPKLSFSVCKTIIKSIIVFQITCFLYAVAQYVFLEFYGVSLYLPYWLYGNIAGGEVETGSRITTVASYWIEFGEENGLYQGLEYIIRPSAFFSEPSYLGFMMLTSFFVVSSTKNRSLTVISFFLSLGTCLVAGTASGIMLLLIYAIFVFKDDKTISRYFIYLAPLVVFSMILLAGVYADRLLNVMDVSKETSGFIRLVKPMMNIYNIFDMGYVFGVPQMLFDNYFDEYYNGIYVGYGVDNALLNLVMNYGLFGIVILYMLVPRNATFALYFFSCLFINGAFLAYDKGAIVGGAVLLVMAFSKYSNFDFRNSKGI